MHRHAERRHLPYPPEAVFDLVADVRRYPEFLPWLRAARVYNERPDGFDADLVVGFKFYTERFTSRVHLERPRRIHVDYIKGPLKYLHNDWRFAPADDGGTIVDFSVEFAFRSPVFEKLMGAVFTEAVHRMVASFEARARQLYGAPAPQGQPASPVKGG